MKSWRDRLNTTIAGVNESSQKIKQQLQQAVQVPTGESVLAAAAAAVGGTTAGSRPATPTTAAQDDQQYLRLPVESAKKLRWFDRHDVDMLMKLHLREKHELFEANSALRHALRRRGLSDASLDAELAAINRQVDAMREQEQGVNQVLVLAAQAEIEQLKEALDSAHHEVQHMRRQRLQAASSGALPPAAVPAPPGDPPAGGQGHEQQQAQAQGAERVELRLRSQEGLDGEAPFVEVALAVVSAGTSSVGPATGGEGAAQQGTPPLPAALAALAQANGSSSSAFDPALLQQGAAALANIARAQGVALPGLGPPDSTAAAKAGSTAAESAANGGAELQAQCNALQVQVGRLQAELEQARQDADYSRDAAERKQQEMRSRFSEAQQRQSEVLRMSQDARLDAESRCEAAERTLQAAEARCARLESESREAKGESRKAHQESKRLEKDLGAAEARALQAEAAAQRARGVAESDAKSHEAVVQLRSRIAELEAAEQQHVRQVAAARQHAEALESRLTGAELAAARSAAEMHELEEAAHERDAMAVRLAMLEERLDETRAERGQAESYRTLAQQSEEKRACAEDELLTTARLASSLEARLAAAARENEGLRLEVQAAMARVLEARRSVPQLVAEQWREAGTDRSRWPLVAQEEMENVEARLAAILSALKEAQAQLEDSRTAADTHRTARTAAEARAAAAEDTSARRQRDAEQRAQRAEAAASAAAVQVAEFREALAAVERERDTLQAERQDRERAARHAAAAVAGARRRTGSGSLQPSDASVAAEASAAAGGLPPRQGSEEGMRSQLPAVKQRDVLESTDVLYLKNVVLKFIDAQLSGRTQECEVLLPAVATLLRASPAEYRVLRSHLQRSAASSWLPASLMGGS